MSTIADINLEARALVDADSTSLTDATLLRRVNMAYEQVVGELIAANTNCNFGDSNFTSLPTGLFTLVNSQEAYQLTGNGTTGINTTTPLLTFLGASVKDVNGLWQVLKPFNLNELLEQGIDPVEFEKSDGLPIYYEIREDFIVLYPAPDNGVSVTLTSGLKVFFQRTASIFTSGEVSTGTKTPGFASPYHMILAYMAALPYAMSFKKDRVPMIVNEIARMKKELLTFYAFKFRDEGRSILSNSKINFR